MYLITKFIGKTVVWRGSTFGCANSSQTHSTLTTLAGGCAGLGGHGAVSQGIAGQSWWAGTQGLVILGQADCIDATLADGARICNTLSK
jgi:hypothetical protein